MILRTYDFVYLSLGAGVQSSALLAMSALELAGCPRAACAVFADTHGEPQWVYDHLGVLQRWAADRELPVFRVTAGDLAQDVIDRHTGKTNRFAAIPAWTTGADGRAAPLRRQCTREYKIEPIERWIRTHLGYERGQRVRHRVACLLGISLDEQIRARPSRTPWITNLFPLIEARLRRFDCAMLLEKVGLPVPRKSACVFCPYHTDEYWRDLKEHHPADFQRAVAFDRSIRDMSRSGIRQPVYLHRSLKPLAEVNFGAERQQWLTGFSSECEGHCGL